MIRNSTSSIANDLDKLIDIKVPLDSPAIPAGVNCVFLSVYGEFLWIERFPNRLTNEGYHGQQYYQRAKGRNHYPWSNSQVSGSLLE